jgi:hypothetical protein
LTKIKFRQRINKYYCTPYRDKIDVIYKILSNLITIDDPFREITDCIKVPARIKIFFIIPIAN